MVTKKGQKNIQVVGWGSLPAACSCSASGRPPETTRSPSWGTSRGYLGDILGIFWGYLGLFWGNLRDIYGISSACVTKFWYQDFVLKYVVEGGKKDFQVETGLFWDLFWSRSGAFIAIYTKMQNCLKHGNPTARSEKVHRET